MTPDDDALGLNEQAGEERPAGRFVHLSLNDDGSINLQFVGCSMPELIRLHWYFGYNLFRQQATDEARTPPAIIRKPEEARDRIILPGKAGMAGGPNREQRRRRPDA